MSNSIFSNVPLASLSGKLLWNQVRDYVLIGFSESSVLSPTPPNTIEFTFSSAANEDCQLIAEYSAGDGIWWPLAFSDTSDGASGNGSIHFQIPSYWAKTRSWDGTLDIPSGSTLYWIRIQRRNPDGSIVGATISNVKATCRPFIVIKRRVDDPFYEYAPSEVGTPIWFKFVSVGGDGTEHSETDILVKTVIQGFSDLPGDAR